MTGAVIVAQQNKMMRRFRDAEALDPDSAQRPEDIGVRNSWVFRKMVERGVFVEGADGLFHIDDQKAAEFVRQRQLRILTFSAIVLVIFIIVMLFIR